MTEDLVLPLDEGELERLDGRFLRELARACGVALWETPAYEGAAP